MAINLRLGGPGDVASALSVYERSNLARRRGNWPSRAPRVKQVAAHLRDPASWFIVGRDGDEDVAMALVSPFRAHRGAGEIVPGAAFLNLIYVLSDRWGEGIGGAVLDTVIEEAARRGCEQIHLWTHEGDNERAQRLYLGRGFRRTGLVDRDEAGEQIAEWLHER